MLKRLSILVAIISIVACDPQDEFINQNAATQDTTTDSVNVNNDANVIINPWKVKADVENELLGAYKALRQNCVTRMAVWGEMRSDNIVEGEGASDDISNICRENLLPSNEFCKYDAFYDVVNRANKVLLFAPQVAALDPDYHMSEFYSHQAEAIALRSICYWYLIRTFRDVPYITNYDESGNLSSNTPQSTFESILDSLITDLENIRNNVFLRYATKEESVSRFTRLSINALLADMYLWRGNADDYDKCIELSQSITSDKLKDYMMLRDEQGDSCTIKFFNGYPLISNSSANNIGNSYNEIFGRGSSFESLFEFLYSDTKNPYVPNYYMKNQTNPGQIKALSWIGDDFSSSTGNRVFEQPQDTRLYQNVWQFDDYTWEICKYVYDDLRLKVDYGRIEPKSASFRNQKEASWIVYRYSEVLLFEAEAYLMKAMQLPDGDSLCIEYKDKALSLIDAVNKRSIVADNETVIPETLASIGYSANTNADELKTLLYNERRRELMFEGKRWFDLVRITLSEGNHGCLSRCLEMKFDAADIVAIKIKFSNPYGLFFPISEEEIEKSNGVLKQNPAYSVDQ